MDELYKKKIDKTLRNSEKILLELEKANKKLNFRLALTAVKIIVIVVPLILAFIYLPPFLEDFIEQYRDILKLLGR